jgi:WD40 repeat protein
VMDGKNNFALTEKIGSDPDDAIGSIATGAKWYYDLRDLYAISNDTDWFIGFSSGQLTSPKATNFTYEVFIDVDNSSSGATLAPGNKLIDFNTAHKGPVFDVAFSPDGSKIATAGGYTPNHADRDGTIKIWSSDGTLLNTLRVFSDTDPPYSLVWSSDGSMLASMDTKHVYVFNTGDWSIKANWDINDYGRWWSISDVRSSTLQFTHNDNYLVAASYRDIYMFNMSNTSDVKVSRLTGDLLNSLAVSPDGQHIAAPETDGKKIGS